MQFHPLCWFQLNLSAVGVVGVVVAVVDVAVVVVAVVDVAVVAD